MSRLTATRTHTICGHNPDNVWADILHGELMLNGPHHRQIQWCSDCGAWRWVFGNPHNGSTLDYSEWAVPKLRKS